MSAATAVATEDATYVIEISYDLTMDYTPSWEPVKGHEPYHSAEVAEAARLAHGEEHEWFDGEAVTRVRRVLNPRPEAGYSDPFLEAEFAANARYWADRAAASRAQEEAEKEMFRLYGKGAVVEVTKGRKVPVGTTGTVFWIGEDKFSRTGAMRIGFKDEADTTHWTALSNVESVTPAFEKES